MQSAFASRLPFEMLDGIRDEDFAPIDSGVSSASSNSAPAGPTNGRPCRSSVIARRLPDQNHVRPRRSLAADGLRRPLVKLATAARLFGGN